LNTIITEETEFGEVPIDIYTKLANDRILFINNHIDDRIATDIVATLLLQSEENSSKKITLIINAESGNVQLNVQLKLFALDLLWMRL